MKKQQARWANVKYIKWISFRKSRMKMKNQSIVSFSNNTPKVNWSHPSPKGNYRKLWARWWRQKIRGEIFAKYTAHTPAPPARINMIVSRGIKTYPTLPERRFLKIMSAAMTTTTTTKNTKKLREGTSWLWRLENQTHNVITQNRVVLGALTAMVTVSKNHLRCLINQGSV